MVIDRPQGGGYFKRLVYLVLLMRDSEGEIEGLQDCLHYYHKFIMWYIRNRMRILSIVIIRSQWDPIMGT